MEEIQQKPDNIYAIIKRYYTQFRNKKNQELFICPKKEEIKIIRVYSRNTIFSSNKNIVKEMLVIHYYRENDLGIDNTPNTYHLSLNLDHYNDLL